jgi:hypothetical protein
MINDHDRNMTVIMAVAVIMAVNMTIISIPFARRTDLWSFCGFSVIAFPLLTKHNIKRIMRR